MRTDHYTRSVRIFFQWLSLSPRANNFPFSGLPLLRSPHSPLANFRVSAISPPRSAFGLQMVRLLSFTVHTGF